MVLERGRQEEDPENLAWTSGPKLTCANVLRVSWGRHQDVFFFIGK